VGIPTPSPTAKAIMWPVDSPWAPPPDVPVGLPVGLPGLVEVGREVAARQLEDS
jgi:hypothetical protein